MDIFSIIYLYSQIIVYLVFWMRFFLLQNFLFTSKDENSPLKAIDFGLSDYVKPGQDYYLRFVSLWLLF